jgi:hypothetical protein
MPRVRSSNQYGANHARLTATLHGSARVERGVCVASGHCDTPAIDGAPFPVCGHHLREAYEFAADMVTDNWDGAVRDYVSGLHDTFKPPTAVKQPRAGWVYFIRFGDRVKVGYTTVPKRRMTQLPHEQIIGMVHGTRDDEAAWHKLLADYHVVGEWFRATPEVIAVLERASARSA